MKEIDSILRQHRQSGLSLLAFAREHDLCYSTLYGWHRRAGGQGKLQEPALVSKPTLIPVELEPSATGGEFVLGWAPNRSLRIPSGFDPVELRGLLEVLGVRP
jgi:hypothetical protein